MLYHYQGSLKELSNKQAADAMQALELKLRTGKFRYHGDDDAPTFQMLKKAVQAEWPEEMVTILRQKGKDMAAAKPMTTALGFAAVMSVVRDVVAPKRAKLRNSEDTVSEALVSEAEARLAILFGKAPSLSERSLPREYGTGKSIAIKPRSRADRLIMDSSNVMEADTYILALFNKDAGIIRLLGWAARQDLKVGEKQIFSLPLCELKPMSEFLWGHKIMAVPNGFLFDQVPDVKDLPLPTRNKNLADVLAPAAPDNGADFWDSIVGKTEPKKTDDVL